MKVLQTIAERPARRQARRKPRLGWLGLLPVTGILLAGVAATPAGAAEHSHTAARAPQAAPHPAETGARGSLAHAPAGLRAAVRAALGRPDAPRGLAVRGSAGYGQTATSLVPADHRADCFGVSVTISGNTALVGATTAHHHTGAVYVFVRGARGWVQQARLTAADGFSQDGFGVSVALDGNTAVIGASNRGLDALRSFHGIGGAYVFVRHGTTWSQQALLSPPPPDSEAGEFFGFSVGISGRTVLVGAPGDSLEEGAVFEFTRTGTTWAQTAKFAGSNSGQFDAFGFSLAFSGSHAVVGAPQRGGFTGEAYVFTQSGTTFTQQADLVIPNGQTGDLFGRSVALSGTTALIGAPGVSGLTGAAYVFVRSGTHWSSQAVLTAADGQSGDALGENAVAVSGNIAVAGADFASGAAGAAYEFVRTGTSWAQKAKFTDSSAAPNDSLGFSVAIAGQTALVGEPHHNNLHGQVDLFPL